MTQCPRSRKPCPHSAGNSSETRASFAWNPIFKPKPWKKWWFGVVFAQNQVMLCGSATFWLEARESSLCLAGSCFMFHVPFGFVSPTWNLGFRWGVLNKENEGGMKSGADKDSTRFIKAIPLSWVTVCSCFVSTFLLERIFCTLNSSLRFSLKEQNY